MSMYNFQLINRKKGMVLLISKQSLNPASLCFSAAFRW